MTTAEFHQTDRAAHRGGKPWDRFSRVLRTLPAAIGQGIASLNLQAGARLLDFGCADQPYRALMPAGVEYVGADLPGNPQASLHLDSAGMLSVPDGSFDAVLSTQVLEHVTDPARYLAECRRVLRPGGQLVLSTHGTMFYHPDPDDYWRWTGAGLRRAVELAGFEVTQLRGVLGLAATGLQLFQEALFWRLPVWLRPPFTLFMQALVSLFDRLESDHSRSVNALVFVVVARKRTPA